MLVFTAIWTVANPLLLLIYKIGYKSKISMPQQMVRWMGRVSLGPRWTEIRTGLDTTFFLCSVDGDRVDDALQGEDPALLTPKIVGKQMLFSVGIYNPNLHPAPRGNYDLIIANDASKGKYQEKFDSRENSR